jgi:hypothetical protein
MQVEDHESLMQLKNFRHLYLEAMRVGDYVPLLYSMTQRQRMQEKRSVEGYGGSWITVQRWWED